MRILFVSPYVPSLIRVRPYNFIRELAKRHEVSVLAVGSGSEPEEAAELQRLCRSVEIVPLKMVSSMRSCAVAAMQGEPLQAAFCRSTNLTSRLASLIAESHFDLVHVEHLRAAHLVDHIPSSVPTLFDSVDCISLLLERTLAASHSLRQRAIAALELSRTRAYEARLLQRFDRVIVTSPEDGGALQALTSGVEVAVVPNGVDQEYFRPRITPRDPATLLFSGKMSYHANATAVLHFVHHILPLVRKVRPDVRLSIVGSSPPAVIRNLSSDPSVSITGYLPDIREAVGQATIAICPVTVKVGIQNKVLEAMAMGLPVVCTKEGAEGLDAKQGRDFLVAGSPTEFANHICRLLADSHMRDRIGWSGRRYVEACHRWDKAAYRLEALYEEAIDCRTRKLETESQFDRTTL